jgi:hypothetical protein
MHGVDPDASHHSSTLNGGDVGSIFPGDRQWSDMIDCVSYRRDLHSQVMLRRDFTAIYMSSNSLPVLLLHNFLHRFFERM